MPDSLGSGVKPVPPALAGEFLIIEPPGKPKSALIKKASLNEITAHREAVFLRLLISSSTYFFRPYQLWAGFRTS